MKSTGLVRRLTDLLELCLAHPELCLGLPELLCSTVMEMVLQMSNF